MTKALQMINIYIYIVWEKGQWKKGHLKMFQGRRDTLFSGNGTFYPLGTILSSGNRTTYPLGIGPLILWKSDHLSSGSRDILWETGYRKRGTISSGIRTTYPLGNILWESGIWEMRYNPFPSPAPLFSV